MSVASVAASPNSATAKAAPQRILGIDPGSRITGFALIKARCPRPLSPKDFTVVQAGVLRAAPTLPHRERLGFLHLALYELMAELQPTVCVIEKAFADKNIATAIKLGELRGAYIAACARCSVQVEEITPAEAKKLITGNGRADKDVVALALKTLLGFDRGTMPTDVTDALAISLCFGLSLTRKWAEARVAAAAQPGARPQSY